MAEFNLGSKSQITVERNTWFGDEMWAEWDSKEPEVRRRELWETMFTEALEDDFGSDTSADIARYAQFTDKDGNTVDLEGLSQLSSKEIIERGFAEEDKFASA